MNNQIINIAAATVRVRRTTVSFTIFIYIVAATLIVPTVTLASINLDQAGKVKLFGDVRFRIEADDDKKQSGETRSRQRWRYRARLGVAFKANDEWSGKLRLATGNGLNSPHNTFSTASSSGTSLGFDQAYVAFTGVPNLTVIGGKTGINFWQQTEVFWDTDINPDALAVVYKTGSVTLNAAYVVVVDGNWDDDVTALTYQAVYQGKSNNMKYTVALGGASVDAPSDPDATDDGLGDGLHADSHWILSGQLQMGPWRFGADYLQSNADNEDTAYVVQLRYKLDKTLGLRAYYYYVETFATLGDGALTQDNFGSAESSADNFDGYRLQLDYKLGNNTSLDVRYYDAEIITKGVDGQASERSRAQVNINVKF